MQIGASKILHSIMTVGYFSGKEDLFVSLRKASDGFYYWGNGGKMFDGFYPPTHTCRFGLEYFYMYGKYKLCGVPYALVTGYAVCESTSNIIMYD
jgi:hypothetical protein